LLEKIFEKYFQGEHNAGSRSPGTGLGLAITRKLIELMGGQIRVTSTKSADSSFTCSIPVSVAEKTTEVNLNPEKKTIEKASRSLNILVAEDNPVNAKLIQKV